MILFIIEYISLIGDPPMSHTTHSQYAIVLLIGAGFYNLEINTMWPFQNRLECLRREYQQTVKKEVLEDVHRERGNEIKLLGEVKTKLESTKEQLNEMEKGNYRMMPELKEFKRSSRPFEPDEVRRKENYKQKKILLEKWAHTKDRDAQISFLLNRKERYERVLKEHTRRLNALNIQYSNPDQYMHKLFTIVFPENPYYSYRVHFGKERELDTFYDDKEIARQRKHRLYVEFDYHVAKKINAISNDFRTHHPQLSPRDWCYLLDKPCYQESCPQVRFNDATRQEEELKHEQTIQKIKTRLEGKELPWWFTRGTQPKVSR
jgi:hypothetical protein